MNLPQIPNYEFIGLIGEGSCGYAYRCRYRDSDERMVKIVKALAVNHGLFVSSMKTVAAARAHRHLVDICGYEFGQNPGYYITSLHGRPEPGGSDWKPSTIEPLMGNLPAEEACRLIGQMADGLAHLHRLEVPHTAFKPSNIFIGENPDGSRRIRISDWGEGYVSGLHYLELGDRGFYASPEQLANGDFSQGKGKRWDVYAFGVVAYRLLTGLLPRLDPQFDAWVDAKRKHEANAMAFGQVLDEPGRYVEWIHTQPDVRWPGQPPNQEEAERRRIIERCLDIDPQTRLADMREVVAEFQQIENAALLRRMEREMSARGQQVTDEFEERAEKAESLAKRRGRQLIRWRAIAAGIVTAVGLIGWGAYKQVNRKLTEAEGKFEDLRTDFKGKIAQERLRFDITLAEKDTAVATVERTAVASSEAADATKGVLLRTQEHGDRFFEMILENRDSDVPGYLEMRRSRLNEAREYYEAQIEVYANDGEFVAHSADAYRFLGEIYLELGDTRRAATALTQAGKRYTSLRDGSAGRAVDAAAAERSMRSLAKVRQRQAEMAVQQQPSAAESLAAIATAQEAWKALESLQPDEIEWPLAQAENRLLGAEAMRTRGDAAKAMQELQLAADSLVALHEKAPNSDRAAAALGRAFAAIGSMLSEVGEVEQAAELLDQSVVLFSNAVTLNGAVDDYQLWMAESLAELGRLRRDPATLNDAVTVLSVAQARDPQEARIASALAVCLGALAEMQRDGGESAVAIEFERRGVSAIETVLAADGAEVGQRIRYLHAERLCHLAELHGDTDQFAESKKSVDGAIAQLSGLLNEDPANATYKRLLARAEGLAAFASEQTGDKDSARAHYSAALTQWQAVSNDHPEDIQAAEGLSWTKRQLEALQ